MHQHSEIFRLSQQRLTHNMNNFKYQTQASQQINSSQQELAFIETPYRKQISSRLLKCRGQSSKSNYSLHNNEGNHTIIQYANQQNSTRNKEQYYNRTTDENYRVQDRYRKIISILEKQNQNLKQQNEQLANRCNNLHNKKEKFKYLYQSTKQTLELIVQERQVYKQKAQQLKKIIQTDMKEFYIHLTNQYQQKQSNFAIIPQQINDFTKKKQGYSNISQDSSQSNNFCKVPVHQQSYLTQFDENGQKKYYYQDQQIYSSGSHTSQYGEQQFCTLPSKKYQIKNKKYKY